MSKKILILLSFLLLQVTSYRAIAAIGDWKAYMAYSEVQEIEQAGNLICEKCAWCRRRIQACRHPRQIHRRNDTATYRGKSCPCGLS